MLSFESVKQRLARESPLSFLEFNYMILQAYDFLMLHRRSGAELQFGGSDQWVRSRPDLPPAPPLAPLLAPPPLFSPTSPDLPPISPDLPRSQGNIINGGAAG